MAKYHVEDMEHSAWLIEADNPKEAASKSIWEDETIDDGRDNGPNTMVYFDVFDSDGQNVDGRCVWLEGYQPGGERRV